MANLPLRPPATLAKAAASLDAMSGGRFELEIGAGTDWKTIGAMGAPCVQTAALRELYEGTDQKPYPCAMRKGSLLATIKLRK